MLSAYGLEQLLTQINALPRPTLTIYAQTGEVRGGAVGDAVRIRVHRALSKLRDAHHELSTRVEDRIVEAMGHPAGRGTVAIFAGAIDDKKPQIITRNLPIELPIGDNELPAEGVVGDPWLDPFRLALSETERVAVVHAHEHGVCFYEVFLGEIERVLDLRLPGLPHEDDRLQRSKTIHPAHIADRGSSGFDDADAHRVAWQRRFYADASADLLPILALRSIDAVLLIGAAQNRQLFEDAAPQPLTAKLIGAGPGLPQQDARPAQLLDAVRELIDEHIDRRKAGALARLQAHAVIGLDDCLTKLQRGQLELLFVPWDLDGELFVEQASGQVASSPGQARALSAAAEVEVTPSPARTKLIELADLYSTTVEFVRAGGSNSPFDAVKGVAGVPRWT